MVSDRKSSYRVRQILSLFCNLTALILGYSSVKGIGVTRIAKGVGFKGVWDELGQGGFQGLPVTGHLRLALVFAWGSALQERFNFSFSRVFWLTKFLIWQGEWALILWVWGTLLIFPNFLRQLVRQFVYTMLISHNRASFHL